MSSLSDFTIRAITLRLCRVELLSRNQYSSGEYDPDIYSAIVQIDLAAPEGTGWGEWLPTSIIYEPGHIGRSPIDEWATARTVAQSLIGRDARMLNLWSTGLFDGLPVEDAANGIIDGFDFALHDAVGRTLGWSVQTLLGGGRPSVSGMPLLYLDTPEATAEKAASYHAQGGYRWFKLKPSCDQGRDSETLRRIREALPDVEGFYIDPNYMLKRDVDGIVAYLNALHPLGLRVCEDPLVPGLDRWREIQSRTEVDLMVDERARTFAQVRAAGEARAARMVNVHANWAAGFRRGLRRAELAAGLGMRSIVGSVRYLGIGTAAYQTFSSLLPYATPCEQVNDAFYVRESVVTAPYAVRNGEILIPQEPGLGIEVNREALDALTVRHETFG